MSPKTALRRAERVIQTLGWVAIDACAIALAALIAYWARFEGPPPTTFAEQAPIFVLGSIAVYVTTFSLFSLYRPLLRFAGVETFSALALATATSAAINFVTVWVLLNQDLLLVPRSLPVIQSVFVFAGASAWRLTGRFPDLMPYARYPQGGRRVVIIGAGSAGALLMRDILAQPDLGLHVVALVDDDPRKLGRTIGGVRVEGPLADLERLADKFAVEEALIALPSAGAEARKRAVEECVNLGLRARIVHGLARPVKVSSLEQVSVEDLLGREPVSLDNEPAREQVQGAVIAVTGAAGSIGSELCRQLVVLRPARLLLIDVDESRLYELMLDLESIAQHVQLQLCLVDVRDADAVQKTFDAFSPDLVFHAAAYKHVPVMEEWPFEAYKANVGGTLNVLAASRRSHVGRFVLISTDKAVNPANHMGLSKAVSELCVLSAVDAGYDATAVRFGNVLGSRGSVVPLFERQLQKGGPLLVTHPEATRYFMTIPEASRLVLQAAALDGGGEIYVLEMGDPVCVMDVARKMIALTDSNARIEFIGLRPGEKLHEELFQGESLEQSGTEGILVQRHRPELPEGFDDLVLQLLDSASEGRYDQVVPLLRTMTGLELPWLDAPRTSRQLEPTR